MGGAVNPAPNWRGNVRTIAQLSRCDWEAAFTPYIEHR